jgi:hypothetical protein
MFTPEVKDDRIWTSNDDFMVVVTLEKCERSKVEGMANIKKMCK